MPQANAETTMATTFAAYATFFGTPLPDNPIAALRILRAEAKQEVDRLIEFLDTTGPDPDLEDGADDELTGDDEPSFGWCDIEARKNRYVEQHYDEGEEDDPGEESDEGEANGDDEPSLGWTNPQPGRQLSQGDSLWSRYQSPIVDEGIDQTSLGGVATIEDLEAEHDGREPDADDEAGGIGRGAQW